MTSGAKQLQIPNEELSEVKPETSLPIGGMMRTTDGDFHVELQAGHTTAVGADTAEPRTQPRCANVTAPRETGTRKLITTRS